MGISHINRLLWECEHLDRGHHFAFSHRILPASLDAHIVGGSHTSTPVGFSTLMGEMYQSGYRCRMVYSSVSDQPLPAISGSGDPSRGV